MLQSLSSKPFYRHMGSGHMRGSTQPLHAYTQRSGLKLGNTPHSQRYSTGFRSQPQSSSFARVSSQHNTRTQHISQAVSNALRPKSLPPSSAPRAPSAPPQQHQRDPSAPMTRTQPTWRGNVIGPDQPLRALFASGAPTLTPPTFNVANKNPHVMIAIGRAGPLEGAPDLQHHQRTAFETAALTQLQQLGVGSSDKCTAFMIRGQPKSASFSLYTIWNTSTCQGRQALQELLSKQALNVPWRGTRVAVPIEVAPTPPPPNAIKILTTHLNPYLACVGYTQTILNSAGYTVESNPSNNDFSHHPSKAKVINEHLGEATWLFGPTSSGNAGAILSWVIPPENDLLLQHLPASFLDSEGKTTFIKVFRPPPPTSNTNSLQIPNSSPESAQNTQTEGHSSRAPIITEAQPTPKRRIELDQTTPATETQGVPTPTNSQADPPSPTRTPHKRGKPTTPHTVMDIDTSLPYLPRPGPSQLGTSQHSEPVARPHEPPQNTQPQPRPDTGANQSTSQLGWQDHPFTAQVNQFLEDQEPPVTQAHKINILNYLYSNHRNLFEKNASAGERPTNLDKKTRSAINKAIKQTSDSSTRTNATSTQDQPLDDQAMHSFGPRSPRGVQPQ